MSRDKYLDSAKGMLIFLVVFGHLVEPMRSDSFILHIYRFIYLFHMPAFIFIAGMFARTSIEKQSAISLMNGVLVPLIAFEVLHELLDFALRGAFAFKITTLTPHWTLWFLLSLFCWRLMTPLIVALRWPLVTSIVIALIALMSSKTGAYLSIARTFSFLPFYTLGVIYGRTIVSRVKSTPRWIALAYSLLAFTAIFFIVPDFSNSILFGSSSFAAMKLSNWDGIQLRMFVYFLAALGVLAFFALALQTHAFARWGERSLIIYLWHGLFLRVFRHFSDNEIMIAHPLTTGALFLIFAAFLCWLLSTEGCRAATEKLFRPLRAAINHPN